MSMQKEDEIDSPEQIARRKIIKIKRHNPKTGVITTEYPKDKFENTLIDSGSKSVGKKEENKSISKNKVPEQLSQVVADAKKIGASDADDNKMVKVGLFQQNSSNLKSSNLQPSAQKSLFGGSASSPQKEEKAEPVKTNANGGLIFGALPSTPATGSSIFGGNAPAAAATGGGLFGSNKSTPPPATGSSLFGGGATAAVAGSGSSLFGGKPKEAASSPEAKPSSSGGFMKGATEQKPPGSLFGGAPAQSSGGLFGGAPAKSDSKPASSLFGGAPAQSSGSLFGGAPAKSDSKPASSLFGGAPAQSSGGLFGGAPADKLPGGSSLFGGAPPVPVQDQGVSLFGGNAQVKTDSKPAGSLFGGIQPSSTDQKPSGSLFGQNQSQTAKPATGSLFGAKPVSTGTSLFGGAPAQDGAEKKIFGGDAKPSTSLFAPAPPGGSLFGNSGPSLFGAQKTFDKPSGSLFGQANNMFAKPQGSEPNKEPEYGDGQEEEENDNYVTNDEPPSILVGETVNTTSPFSKVIETTVEKFKFQLNPTKDQPDIDKKSCGNGRVSINKAELTPGVFTIKLIFRSNLGKILFDQNIHFQSKCKQVEEKAQKHQLKVLTVKYDLATKKQQKSICKINFQRKTDMIEFEKKVQQSILDVKPKAK